MSVRDRIDPWLRGVLGTLLGATALNAFGGGIYGVLGARGVPTSWLRGSPFGDYLVPSLILLVVVGGSLAIAAVAVFTRRRTAKRAALAAGWILMGWIGVQVAIIGFVSWLQPAMTFTGALILVLGSLTRSPPLSGAPRP